MKGAAVAGVGGLPPRRLDQRLTGTSRAGVGPAPQTGFFIGKFVVIFGTGGGLFIYNGIPGPGNAPILYETAPGVTHDPYGNGLPITSGGLVSQNQTLPSRATQLNFSILSFFQGGQNWANVQLEDLGVNPILSLGVGAGGSIYLGSGAFLAAGFMIIPPSGDTTGVEDSAVIAGAFLQVPAVYLTPGAFYLRPGLITMGAGQYLHTEGATIHCVPDGSGLPGDYIRMVSPTGSSPVGGGILGRGVFDGTTALAGSSGIHAGDMFQLEFDVKSQNFTGAGSKNWWFDNQYSFTEQITGKIYSGPGTSGVVFDNSTGTTLSANATGSFDRFNAAIYLNGMAGNAVTLQNGAFIIDPGPEAGIYGNMVTGAAVQTACLLLTGSNAAGFSLIRGGQFSIGVELRNAGGNVPMTINFGTVVSNNITDCTGIMDFSANFAFAQSNNYTGSGVGSFRYDGPVYGDITLQRATGLGRSPFINTALVNGSTIATKYTGLVRVATTGGADITGVILQGFNPDEWRDVTVMNIGPTGSITFDIPANSQVADGQLCSIPANTAATFHWSPDENRWFRAESPAYQVSVIEPGTTATPETWHSVSLSAGGWAGTLRYRLRIENEVSLSADVLTAGANATVVTTLPAGYRPASEQRMPLITTGAVYGTSSPVCAVEPNGDVSMSGITAAMTTVSLNCRYPLD